MLTGDRVEAKGGVRIQRKSLNRIRDSNRMNGAKEKRMLGEGFRQLRIPERKDYDSSFSPSLGFLLSL